MREGTREIQLLRRESAKNISDTIQKHPQKYIQLHSLKVSDEIYKKIIKNLSLDNISKDKISTKFFRETFSRLIEGAKKSQNEFYINLLVRVIAHAATEIAPYLLESFQDQMDKTFITDLVAVLVQFISSQNSMLGVDFARKSADGAQSGVKSLLKIAMLNDEGSQNVIERLTEPRCKATRCITLQDHLISYCVEIDYEAKKLRDKEYYAVNSDVIRSQSLPFLANCALEYQKTADKESHPGNMLLLPPGITEPCVLLFKSLIKTNINSVLYKKSKKIKYTLTLKDGTKKDVFISCYVIGLFWTFLNLVNLGSVIRASNEKYLNDIKNLSIFNQSKIKKQIQKRNFSDESLAQGLCDIFYDIDFLLMPHFHFKETLKKLGHNSDELITEEFIRQEKLNIIKNIKFEFDRFFFNTPIKDEDEKKLVKDVKLLLEKLNVENIHTQLLELKNTIIVLIDKLEYKRKSDIIRPQLKDSEFRKLINRIPTLSLSDSDISTVLRSLFSNNLSQLKNLENQDFGKALNNVLCNIDIAKLFVLNNMQRKFTKLMPVVPDVILANRARKMIKNPMFVPQQLPLQVEGLSIQPNSNLCESLKLMFNLPAVQKATPANIRDHLLKSLTDFESELCAKLKQFITKPNFLRFSLDQLDIQIKNKFAEKFTKEHLAKFVWQRNKWINLEKLLLELLSSHHFQKTFDEYWSKHDFKKPMMKIVSFPIMYNKYNPFICLSLLYTHFHKLNDLDMHNLVHKSELYLRYTLENTTRSAANYIYSSFKDNPTSEASDSYSASKNYSIATTNLGVNADIAYEAEEHEKTYNYVLTLDDNKATDHNSENKIKTRKYYHTLMDVCFGLTGLFKEFDRDDEFYEFLVQFCSDSDQLSDTNAKKRIFSQEEISLNNSKWSKEIFYEIENALLAAGSSENDFEPDIQECEALAISLALQEQDYKKIEDILNHCKHFDVIYLDGAREGEIKTLLAYAFKYEFPFAQSVLSFCQKHYENPEIQTEVKDVIVDLLNYLNPESKFTKKYKQALINLFAKVGMTTPDWLELIKDSTKSSYDTFENSELLRKNSSKGMAKQPKVYLEEVLRGELGIDQLGAIINLFNDVGLFIVIMRSHLSSLSTSHYTYDVNNLLNVLRFLSEKAKKDPITYIIFEELKQEIRISFSSYFKDDSERNKILAELGLQEINISDSNFSDSPVFV